MGEKDVLKVEEEKETGERKNELLSFDRCGMYAKLKPEIALASRHAPKAAEFLENRRWTRDYERQGMVGSLLKIPYPIPFFDRCTLPLRAALSNCTVTR